MDRITPSLEAATVTTAKGTSIGCVAFVLGTMPRVPLNVRGAWQWGALSDYLLWGTRAWPKNLQLRGGGGREGVWVSLAGPGRKQGGD